MDASIPFIDEIISIIVSLARPDQIILFGSYARGENNNKSDIDLMILKKNLSNGRELTGKLYREFYEKKIGIPVDIIAVDYDKYLQLNNEIGYIYKTVKNEGKVIYEAA